VRRLGLIIVLALGACQASEPNLSQTEQFAVVVTPLTKDFGSLQVGMTSAYTTFNVNPATGNQDDNVTAVTANCPDFIVNAPGLPAHVYRVCEYCDPLTCAAPAPCYTLEYQTYQFTAAFKPTIAGAVSCVVNIALNGGTTMKTVTLTGTGTVPPIDIDVTPTALNFGDVRRNTASTPIGITVKNKGGTTMTVSSVSISSGYVITQGPTTSYQLTPGASQPYQVTCNPTATGSHPGSFVVTSNDPMTPTVTVPLQCNGIDSNVALAPSPTTVPTTRVGEPQTVTVAISNSGAASMMLQGISVTGTDLMLMSAPGNGTYVTGPVGNAVIRFGATDKGTQTGTLTVTYDGGQTRTSTISASALATSMALTPDGDVDFGPVCAGQSAMRTFSLLANEEGSFQVTQLGGAVPPFTVTTPTLPVTVQGSGATTVSFSVTASPTTDGTQTSELNLVTNIPNSAPRTINLTVEALAAGVSPSPVMLDFGSTPEMTTTIGQSVTLSNCATAPAAFSNARIEGSDAGEFAIVATPDGSTIGANGNASWLIVLSARSAGLKHAEFLVDLEDGTTARVPLDGEGLGDDVITPGGEDPDEVSYYTCSAGSSSRAWPLALVLGILLRRRRRGRQSRPRASFGPN